MISLLLTFSLVLFVLFCLCFCLFVFGCVIQYSEHLSHFPDICSPFLCSWSRDNNELYLVHIWNHFYFYEFVNVSKAENWIYVARLLTCGAHLQYIESIEYIKNIVNILKVESILQWLTYVYLSILIRQTTQFLARWSFSACSCVKAITNPPVFILRGHKSMSSLPNPRAWLNSEFLQYPYLQDLCALQV